MDNKGYTLVELLATIVILGLVLTIATIGINSISKMIRENQRNNVIKKIEIAASKYAFDTGKTIIFVDELITKGYIESDNNSGYLNDPVNNKKLNCYIVEMERESDYYNSKFINNKSYETAEGCDENIINELNESITIEVNSNGNNEYGWRSGDITLKAISNIVDINCDNENTKCTWSSTTGKNSEGRREITITGITKTLETRYTFQMIKYDELNGEIKKYTESINLKIDNASPIIYENEISVTDKFIYTDTKDVEIIASDGKGSGISGYYLGTGVSCYSDSLAWQTSNIYTIDAPGDYIICVKDKIGNISSYTGLNINYIN